MAHPTLNPTINESMTEAERHLTAALKCLFDARNTAIDDQSECMGPGMGERRKLYALTNRALILAEKLTREALEVVSC
jgi:hypothetical protein